MIDRGNRLLQLSLSARGCALVGVALSLMATLAVLTPRTALAHGRVAHTEESDDDESIDDAQPVDARAAAELTLPSGVSWQTDAETSGNSGGSLKASAQLHGHRVSSFASYVAKAGETLRAIAYRYCTSPVIVAMANRIGFDPEHDVPLHRGTALQVPVAYRAPVGFREAEQLVSAPGIVSSKSDSNWGRPPMVSLLRRAFHEVYKRWPSRHPALVGSLSRPGGGRLGHHKSHRSGQDVDIGYFTMEANRQTWGRPNLDEIDYQRTWFLIDSLERTGQLAAIYMASDVQRRLYTYAAAHGEPKERLAILFQYPGAKGEKTTLIRYAPGHRDHFHVRFACPEDFPSLSRDRDS